MLPPVTPQKVKLQAIKAEKVPNILGVVLLKV
jgi:hypothetical protein